MEDISRVRINRMTPKQHILKLAFVITIVKKLGLILMHMVYMDRMA